jgi:hypothetical protein
MSDSQSTNASLPAAQQHLALHPMRLQPELEQSILNAKALRKQFLKQRDEVLAGYSIEVRGRAKVA